MQRKEEVPLQIRIAMRTLPPLVLEGFPPFAVQIASATYACTCRHSTITIQGVLGALLTSSIFLGAPDCLYPLSLLQCAGRVSPR